MSNEIDAAIEQLTAAPPPPAPAPNPHLPAGVPPVDQAYDPAPAEPSAPSAVVLHKKCGTKTNIGPALAKSHRANPGLFLTMPCHKCGGNHAVAEFTWENGDTFAAAE